MNNKPQKKKNSRRGWLLALGSFLTYGLWRRWRGGAQGDERDVPQETKQRGHEGYATSHAGGLAAAGIGLLLLTLVFIGATVWLFGLFVGGREAPAPVAGRFAGEVQVPPAPRLQQDPAVDLRAMHAAENELLHTYGWADRDSNVVRIPIDRAMDLIAERGLPTRPGPRPDSARVPTESGFRTVRLGPPPPSSPAYLGSSPEPYVPAPEVARALGLYAPFSLHPADTLSGGMPYANPESSQ